MNRHPIRLALALAVVLTLACSWLSGALPDISESSEETAPSGVGPSEGGGAAEGLDMIDQTISLRSVQLSLTASYPDGSMRSLTGEIDDAGNLHLVEPLDPGPEISTTLTPPTGGWGAFELYLVDGHAYPLVPGGAPAQDDAYLGSLGEELRSPDGPGLWLLWAGTQDLEPAGHEAMGGFSAIRYPVDADLGDGTIQGTIWVDEDTSALVRAELTISPALFSTSANPASGDLSILFEVVRAEIAPIHLP